MKKLSKILLSIVTILGLASLCTVPTFADISDTCNENIPLEVRQAAGCPGTSVVKIEDVISGILYGIIAILGFVAVIFIIKGGIDYITSSGDAGKTKKARDTIIYAVIGLVVCVLAFAIVNFTIGIIKKSSTPSGNGTGTDSSQTAPAENKTQ